MSDELKALVAGVLADLDGAGALADALQEAGRNREAVLLRRRWKAWKTERAKAVREDEQYAEAVRRAMPDLQSDPLQRWRAFTMRADGADTRFRHYVRERFGGGLTVAGVRYWTVSFGIGCVVCWDEHGMVRTACDVTIMGGRVTTDRPRRICRKCRATLPAMKPAKTTEGATA